MATAWAIEAGFPMPRHGALSRPEAAIGTPLIDALLIWGAPLIACIAIKLLMLWVVGQPADLQHSEIVAMIAAVGVLTFAHLIAVVPRAYLNRDVFTAHRRRLTIVPVLLITLLIASPAALVVAGVVALFWDVHHSAMQTFGFGRIYDLKHGNDPAVLRRTDLLLNWALYIGPLAAGAALMVHIKWLDRFSRLDWQTLAHMPGLIQGHLGPIHVAALGLTGAALVGSALAYSRAMRRGYRLPPHKAALLLSTGTVSVVAWGFSPPPMALAIVNLFHALQYFTIVWLKEGGRIRVALRMPAVPAWIGCAAFCALCVLFGLAYHSVTGALLAPFIACSLLHFWYDGFIWSVRRRTV